MRIKNRQVGEDTSISRCLSNLKLIRCEGFVIFSHWMKGLKI